ncbi:hypothetical protein ADT71_06670 [Novosphingobium sp. ST904]|nr:hypothetical protein ADT71_06670 [Novosphingobium sp. ST904]
MAFKSNEAFYDYQSMFGDTKLRHGQPCFGLVIKDCSDLVPTTPPERAFLISLASQDGGISKIAKHNQLKGPIRPGDLIAWVPLTQYGPEETEWDGALIALCAPEFNDNGVKVITYF